MNDNEVFGDHRVINRTFFAGARLEVTDVGRELGKSVSLSEGKQQIQAALQGLASSYETALAPIDCS